MPKALDHCQSSTLFTNPPASGFVAWINGGSIQFPIHRYKGFSGRMAFQDRKPSEKRSIQTPCEEQGSTIRLPVGQAPVRKGQEMFVTRGRQARRPVPLRLCQVNSLGVPSGPFDRAAGGRCHTAGQQPPISPRAFLSGHRSRFQGAARRSYGDTDHVSGNHHLDAAIQLTPGGRVVGSHRILFP
jgi:hypothetical protein